MTFSFDNGGTAVSLHGHCIQHGQWWGGFQCPACANPANPAIPQGWECPKCHRVHAPSVFLCPYHPHAAEWPKP